MSETDVSFQAGRMIGRRTRSDRATGSLLPMRPTEVGSQEPLPDHTMLHGRASGFCVFPEKGSHRPLSNRPMKSQQPRINQQPTIKENRL